MPGRRPAGPALPGVVLAPTPTDEALPWPAVLVLDVPLDPGRRALARVPATTTVLRAAAAAYADLLAQRAAAGEDVLDLVPTGLPAGDVDAEVRAALSEALGTAAVLRPVDGGAPLRPGGAVVLDGDLGDDAGALGALAPLVGGLVGAPRRHRALLGSLGATTLALADLVEAVPLEQDPVAWAALARALAPAAADPGAREQLALLPVPLAGGRSVRGARGVLVAADPLAGRGPGGPRRPRAARGGPARGAGPGGRRPARAAGRADGQRPGGAGRPRRGRRGRGRRRRGRRRRGRRRRGRRRRGRGRARRAGRCLRPAGWAVPLPAGWVVPLPAGWPTPC